jgi:hypothetical protein
MKMPNPEEPDALLATFAELTEAVPKPRLRLQRSIAPALGRLAVSTAAVVVLALVGALLLTAVAPDMRLGIGPVAQTPSPDASATGAISLDLSYERPPIGRPMSIGGYAMFGQLTSPGGETVLAGELRPVHLTGLEPGAYEFSVSVRAASDAISVDNNGNYQRDFGPVSATCSATLHVGPAEVAAVLVTAIGGDSCQITAGASTTMGPNASAPVEPTPSAVPTDDNNVFTTGWTLDAASPVDAGSTSFHALVTQAACQLESNSVGPVLPPDVAYTNTAIVVTFTAKFGFDPAACDKLVDDVVVPTVVQLSQPIGDRVLMDGSQEFPAPRWRQPPDDALALPSYADAPFPLGVPIGRPGICAGVGLDGVVIDGSPDDPRLVWLSSDTTQSGGRLLLWPPGFTVRFTDVVEVLDETAAVVHRGGESVDGACVVGDGAHSLYGDGYVVLK